MAPALAAELRSLVGQEPIDLPRAALVIPKAESPSLDPEQTLAALHALGDRAHQRLADRFGASVRDRIAELNRFLFEDEKFSGNRLQYKDFRNSLLNVVIER